MRDESTIPTTAATTTAHDASLPGPRARRIVHHRDGGFTVIELLTVIGIIVILAGLLIMGTHKILDSSHERQTRVTLNILNGLLAEYDAKTRLINSPAGWVWPGIGQNPEAIAPNSANGIDFWHIPYSNGPVYRQPDALSVGEVSDRSPISIATRNGSPAVMNTQTAMLMLLSIPANRAIVEKLSADRFLIPEWTDQPMILSGSDAFPMTGDDSTPTFARYITGHVVQHNGAKYRCETSSSLTPGPAPSGSSPWLSASGAIPPILLDGWNNPIIFVPGTGLRVRMLNGASSYGTRNASGSYSNIPTEVKSVIVTAPGGVVDTKTIVGVPRVLTPGRPFFASAGPDGNFATGEDNVYSFEAP